VRAAGVSLYEAFEQNSSSRSEQWRFNEQERIREVIAGFIGSPSVANVAMVPNFSWALNGVVQSLKGKKQRVLLYNNDYPSVLDPFRINGFDITLVSSPDGFNLPIEEIKSIIQNGQVDIVVLSHVQWASGYKLDIDMVAKWCKEAGIIFIVDATQSLGAMPIDVYTIGADILIASNYKWMNAGFGTGIMYISDKFLEAYPPVVAGHNSYTMHDGKWGYIPGARSYEPGHPNMFGLNILEAAIQQKNAIGIMNIEKHNHALTASLLQQLKHIPAKLVGGYDMDNRCSIIFLKDEMGLGDWLKQQNIIVTQRDGHLRISMHFYNTEADVSALINSLKEFYKS
jgi:selenocysteine lyase/cysteine desulfurase